MRQGFEPWVPFKGYNALAKRRFRPLSHLTKNLSRMIRPLFLVHFGRRGKRNQFRRIQFSRQHEVSRPRPGQFPSTRRGFRVSSVIMPKFLPLIFPPPLPCSWARARTIQNRPRTFTSGIPPRSSFSTSPRRREAASTPTSAAGKTCAYRRRPNTRCGLSPPSRGSRSPGRFRN